MSSWERDLSTVNTEEDFEAIKHLIKNNGPRHHLHINSPIVLGCYLEHISPIPEKKLKEIFKHVSRSFRVDMLSELIPKYVNVDTQDSMLHRYAFDVVEEGYVDVMTFLLDNGITNIPKDGSDYNHLDACFSMACRLGKVDLMDLFLARGGNVNRVDVFRTPLVLSSLHSGDIRVLDRLIMHGADLTAKDTRGQNIWKYATEDYCFWSDPEVLFQRLHDMRVPVETNIIYSFLTEHKRLSMKPGPYQQRDHSFVERCVDIMQSAGARPYNG